jgi:hypothetical protein
VDGWLVAGCLFQTVWNLQAGRAPEAGIKDYDIFYFDAGDVSVAAEAAVQARVERALGSVAAPIEVKNQARVHLWYEERFGHVYPAGISTCTCAGSAISKPVIMCGVASNARNPMCTASSRMAAAGSSEQYTALMRLRFQRPPAT